MKTKATWIIENFTGDNSYDSLIKEAQTQGHDTLVMGVKNHFEFDKSKVKDNSCVIFQGSIQMARFMKEQLPTCYPVSWNNMEAFKCSKFYPHLGKHLFNDRYAMVSVNELKRQKWDYYSMFGKQALIFVRPDDGDKSFTGGLLDIIDFDRFWENKISSLAKPEDLVVVSTPKKIMGEWRFVVTNQKEIITYSTYQYQGQVAKVPGAPTGAIEKCKEVLNEGYFPDPVFVIDICEDSDGNFWLLELGSFSSCGLYACDMNKIVKRVSKIAEEEYDRYQLQKQLPQ